MENVDFGQANACNVIGSAHDGGISSRGQVKHECRFQRIWRRESILLDVDRVNIVLPVVVGCDDRASRVVDRQYGIAYYSAHAVRSERWAKGAHDDRRLFYVS